MGFSQLIPPDDTWNATFHWLYISADGSEHFLYPSPSRPGLPFEDPEDLTVLGDPVTAQDQLTLYSRDSTYLRARRAALGAPWTIEYPGGKRETHTNIGMEEDPDYRLTEIADPHGNAVTLTYAADGLTWTISDPHRTHEVIFMDPGAGFPDQRRLVERVRVRQFGGAFAEYVFSYGTLTVTRPPAHTASSRTLSVRVLTQVTLPEPGLSYDIATSDYLASEGGVLERLGLPTLGAWEWSWAGIQFPLFQTVPRNQDEPVDPFRRVVGVSARRVIDLDGTELGDWTYQREVDGTDIPPGPYPEKMTVTVETPLGDQQKHYFSVWSVVDGLGSSRWGTSWGEYGLPYTRETPDPLGGGRFLSSEIFDCAPGGVSCTKVRTDYVAYEQQAIGTVNDETGILFNTDRRLESQRTVYHDDGDRWVSTTNSDFDGLGHYRQQTTGGNFGAGDVVVSFVDWNPNSGTFPNHMVPDSTDPWLLESFDYQEVTEGGITARLEACFEALTGFLLRQRTVAEGTAPTAADLVREFADPDGDGFAETERLYGGDTQTVPTGDLCTLTLPTPAYELSHVDSCGALTTSEFVGSDFKLVDRTLDCSSGLVASQREIDGTGASYTYDALSRLTRVTPTSPGLDDTVTTITYTPASTPPSGPPIKSRVLIQAGGAEQDYHRDGLGRLVREGRRMVLDNGQGTPLVVYRNRFTTYNGLGLRTTISEWGDPQAVTTFSGFDPFGRPTTVTAPDGSRVTFSYTGSRQVARTASIATSQTREELFTTTETYDRQGRLISVVEPSGVDAANPTTTATYGYDVGGRLTDVAVTGFVPSLGTVTQTRQFTYDQRGLLLSESHPEKSALIGTGNGTVVYSDYDALGNIGRIDEDKQQLTFEYDGAGRLTEVWGPDPNITGYTRRPLKRFTFGTGTASTDVSRGKLKVGSRVELYPLDDSSVFEIELRETHTYGGRQGRVSGKRTELYVTIVALPTAAGSSPLPLGQSPGSEATDAFTQSWTYTNLGSLDTVGYPECVVGTCTQEVGLPSSPTISYTYNRGFLTRVPGYTTGTMTYHASGLVHRLPHANGVTDLQLADGSLGRPASRETLGASNDWSSGTYAYDGTGNIKAIGASWFAYDGVSRLRQAQIVDTLPASIFEDGFESGDTSAWDEGSELSLASLTTTATQSYTYDPFGSLAAIAGDDGLTIPTDSRKNRLSGGTYDRRGNLIAWNGQQYDYDAFNNIKRFRAGAEDALYIYSVDDERILSIGLTPEPINRWTLRSLDARVLRVYTNLRDGTFTPPWEVERDYVYGNGQLIAARIFEGNALDEVRHFHLDHLGTPRLITGDDGRTRARHTYLPYGRELTAVSQDDERLKFTSHERDVNASTGSNPAGDDLDYMHARFYKPELGRFLSVDPIGGNLKAPQSWNRYSYVKNRPISFLDPSGLILISHDVETLKEIAGDAAERLRVHEDGIVDVSLFTQDDIESNEGAALLHDLVTSQNVYTYTEGSVIQTAAGPLPISGGVENLDDRPDSRFRSGKSPKFLPEPGVNGAVVADPAARYVDSETRSLSVSRAALAFHELAEAFVKVDLETEYRLPSGLPGGAHDTAVVWESLLIRQRNGFTDYPAGGRLKNLTPTE